MYTSAKTIFSITDDKGPNKQSTWANLSDGLLAARYKVLSEGCSRKYFEAKTCKILLMKQVGELYLCHKYLENLYVLLNISSQCKIILKYFFNIGMFHC